MSRSSNEIYDELLVIRCQRRDLGAWDELVTRWNDRLLYYLRRLIDREQDATNVLQDVWLHTFRGIGSLRDGARLAPWLYTIARRTAMTRLRREYSVLEEPASELIAGEIDDANEQEHFDNAELVHFGLGRLGLPEREILTLYFLDDLSIDEIADLLRVPAGTVKSRLFKARRDLRCILERESIHHEQ